MRFRKRIDNWNPEAEIARKEETMFIEQVSNFNIYSSEKELK